MFIQTEETPNPLSLKFLLPETITATPTFYTSKEKATNSPLVMRLFLVEGVEAVFLGKDFITITKTLEAEWKTLKPILLAEMVDFLAAGLPVQTETTTERQVGLAEDNEIVQQIKEIIETRVRPAVAQDGGDIVFHSFEDGVVFLEMHGACSGCPSSTATLKSGIENMLRYYVPEVIEVQPINQ